MSQAHVLCVCADQSLAAVVRQGLPADVQFHTVDTVQGAAQWLRSSAAEVLVGDQALDGALNLMESVAKLHPASCRILLADRQCAQSVESCADAGHVSVLLWKPVRAFEVRMAIGRALELSRLRQQMAHCNTVCDRVGSTVPLGLCQLSSDGRFVEPNQQFCEMLGYAAAELGHLLFTDIAHVDDLPLVESQLAALASQAQERADFEVRYVRRSGEVIRARTVATRLGAEISGPASLVVACLDVTQLRTTETQNEALLESAPDAIIVVGANGQIVRFNSAAEVLFGYSRSERLGQPLTSVLPVAFRQREGIAHRTSLRSFSMSVKREENLFVQRKDGSTVPVEVDLSPVRTDEGIRTIVVVRDISDRIQASRRMQALSDRLTLATKVAKIGVWDWSLISGFQVWDETMLELLGAVSADEPRDAESWARYVHPDDYPRLQQEMREALSGNSSFDTEFRVGANGDAPRVLRATATVEFDEQRSPLRMVGVCWDITEARNTEAVLVAMNEELVSASAEQAEREEQYKALLASTNDFVWELDVEGRYVFVSPQCYEILGYQPEELLGATPFEFMTPGDREFAQREFELAVASASPIERLETVRRHQRGHQVVTETSGVRIVTPTGDYRGYRGVTRDVTERRRTALALAMREEELARAEEIAKLGSYSIRYQRREVRWTDGLSRILGLAEGPFDPERLLAVVHPDEREAVRAAVHQILAGPLASMRLDYRIVLPSGEVRYIESRGEIRRGANGEALALDGTLIDVTDSRIMAEEQQNLLAETGELVKELHCLFGIAEMTRESDALSSDVFQRIVDRAVGSWLAPDVICARIAIDGHTYRTECDHEAQIGVESEIWTNGVSRGRVGLGHAPGWNGDGDDGRQMNRQGLVDGIAHLIAQKLESEQAQQAVRDSESRYRILLEQNPDGVLIIDVESQNCVFTNSTAIKSFGYAHDELLALRISDLLAPDWPGNAVLLAEVVKAGGGFLEAVPCRRKNGSVFFAEVNAAMIDFGGRPHALGVFRDITLRRQMELERARDDERFQYLFRLSQIGAGHLEYLLGAALEQAVALARSEVAYVHFYDEVSRQITLGQWSSAVEQACGTWPVGEYSIDDVGVWADSLRQIGSAIHNEYSEVDLLPVGSVALTRHLSVPILDAGRVVGIVGVGNRDQPYESIDAKQLALYMDGAWAIIQRRRAETSLREANEKVARERDVAAGIINSLPGVFFMFDHELRLLRWNRNVEEWLGYEPEALRQSKAVIAVHPQDNSGVQAAIRRAFDQGAASVEYRHRLSDERWIPVLASVKRVTMGEGPVVVMLATDIENLKAAEAQLRKLTAAIEQSPVSVMITDTQGIIEYVNPKFVEVTGYPSEESIGENLVALQAGYQSPQLYSELWQVLSSGIEWRGEIRNRKKSGESYWEQVHLSPVRDIEGKITHYVSVNEDVTEQRETAEALERAKNEAERASRVKSQFLANMSHEIRTPLNAILGYAQLLHRDRSMSAPHAQQLAVIHRSGEHLLALINDILEMSKIEAGHAALVKDAFDLHSLVRDVEQLFLMRAEDKGLRLSCTIADTVPGWVIGDAGKVRQVIANLVSNAVKFTDNGTVWIRVSCEADQDESFTISVDVEDTGPGIEHSLMSTLFAPFEQGAAGNRAGGGTGLGMAISRSFARLHGGDLTITDRSGEGSSFRFQFEVERAELAQRPLSVRHRVVRVAPQDEGKTVLVVDDDSTNRDVLGRLLEEIGLVVLYASTGAEAIAVSQLEHPQAVLMDLRMPDMDGNEATEKLRSDPSCQDIPVVIVSASALETERQRSLEAGAQCFVRKPFRESDIFEALREVCGFEYLYDESIAPIRTSAVALIRSLPPAGVDLTTEEAAQMADAAEEGDRTALLALVEQLGARAPASAALLERLALDYDYDALLRVFESRRKPEDD